MSEDRILFLAQKIEELEDRTRAMNLIDIETLQSELKELTRTVKQQGEMIRTLSRSSEDRPLQTK